MKLLPLLLPLAAALTGCQRTPTDDRAGAARDVAMVEAAQRVKPPAAPLTPQPVSFAELVGPGSVLRLPPDVKQPAPGEGCGFVTADARANAPVLVAVPAVALVKLDGAVAMLAADSGSPRLSSGLHTSYASGGNAVALTEGEAAAAGARKASLTIRDAYDRIVYFSAGELRCGVAARG